MTEAEQFAALNTPDWLTAFRVKVNDIETNLATLEVSVPNFRFAINGVPCQVRRTGDNEAVASVGQDDTGGWMYEITAPAGWFQPPTTTTGG